MMVHVAVPGINGIEQDHIALHILRMMNANKRRKLRRRYIGSKGESGTLSQMKTIQEIAYE